ncbi:hypothetical protein K432DRAFT_308270, partial [Lepidopterella palustris CBS 459.81]
FCHLRLDSKPVYDALPYTWGNPNNVIAIKLDGYSLLVTVYWGVVLRNFRDEQ